MEPEERNDDLYHGIFAGIALTLIVIAVILTLAGCAQKKPEAAKLQEGAKIWAKISGTPPTFISPIPSYTGTAQMGRVLLRKAKSTGNITGGDGWSDKLATYYDTHGMNITNAASPAEAEGTIYIPSETVDSSTWMPNHPRSYENGVCPVCGKRAEPYTLARWQVCAQAYKSAGDGTVWISYDCSKFDPKKHGVQITRCSRCNAAFYQDPELEPESGAKP